jgi:hypothetical protein
MIRLWNLDDDNERVLDGGHNVRIVPVAFSSNDSLLASGCSDG